MISASSLFEVKNGLAVLDLLSRDHQRHGAPLGGLEHKHNRRAEVELSEEAPLFGLQPSDALLVTLSRFLPVLLLRVRAQLGITVYADAADVRGSDSPQGEESVLPRARVNHTLVEMEET